MIEYDSTIGRRVGKALLDDKDLGTDFDFLYCDGIAYCGDYSTWGGGVYNEVRKFAFWSRGCLWVAKYLFGSNRIEFRCVERNEDDSLVESSIHQLIDCFTDDEDISLYHRIVADVDEGTMVVEYFWDLDELNVPTEEYSEGDGIVGENYWDLYRR